MITCKCTNVRKNIQARSNAAGIRYYRNLMN